LLQAFIARSYTNCNDPFPSPSACPELTDKWYSRERARELTSALG